MYKMTAPHLADENAAKSLGITEFQLWGSATKAIYFKRGSILVPYVESFFALVQRIFLLSARQSFLTILSPTVQ